jgi:probable O-glycosylation ligase (exosortase A-associated)
MRSFFLLLAIFALLPVAFLKPHVGILLWSWLAYMNPDELVWGAAQQVPFSMLVAVVTLLGWTFSREPKTIPINSVTILLVAFCIWIGVTTIFAILPDLAFKKWVLVMKMMLMTFVTMFLMQSRERIHVLVWVIVLAVGFFGVKGGIFFILTGGEYRIYGPGGTVGANNAIALALIMVFPLMRYLQIVTESIWIRRGLFLTMFLCLLSIIGTQSRGALLALVAMLGFLVIKSKRRVLYGSLIAFMIMISLSLTPDFWFTRMESISNYEQDLSAMTRIEIWKLAFNIARESPIIGGGFNVFDEYDLYVRHDIDLDRTRSPHSNYFEVLGEHGYIGLGLFLLLILVSWRACSRIVRDARITSELYWAEHLARMLQVAMVGYLVGGSFLNKAYLDLFYTVVALTVVTRAVTSRYIKVNAVDASPSAFAGQATRRGPGWSLDRGPMR